MKSWLEGRNRVGRCVQATGMTISLIILSSKADSNTWERSELKLESVHQESPRSDIFRKRATKQLLKQKHCQKHLTWAKEKKNWTVAQWSKVLFSDAFFCWQALWRCWFHFPAGLGTCPHRQRYQKLVQWPWCYCAWLARKLAWPEPHRESMGIVKRKMRDTRPNNADDLKAAIKATWASITPEQCHRLIASMPRCIDAVIHAKGGPTKYWVHRN